MWGLPLPPPDQKAREVRASLELPGLCCHVQHSPTCRGSRAPAGRNTSVLTSRHSRWVLCGRHHPEMPGEGKSLMVHGNRQGTSEGTLLIETMGSEPPSLALLTGLAAGRPSSSQTRTSFAFIFTLFPYKWESGKTHTAPSLNAAPWEEPAAGRSYAVVLGSEAILPEPQRVPLPESAGSPECVSGLLLH